MNKSIKMIKGFQNLSDKKTRGDMAEKNGKYGWPSFVKFKKDMFSLFKEYFKDSEQEIKTIKTSLINHITNSDKKLKNLQTSLNNHLKTETKKTHDKLDKILRLRIAFPQTFKTIFHFPDPCKVFSLYKQKSLHH